MGFNFRDVGPMVGPGNSRFPAGRLFRSGCPGKTSAAEFARTIRESGIRSIVDLRCADERTESPEYYETLAEVAVASIPLLDIIEDRWANPRSTDVLSTALRYLEMIEASGRALPSIFRWLAGPDHLPVLVHCAAGRDRTGLVCALVLGAFGTELEQIAADYALSHGQVDDGYGAQTETMTELFRLIQGKYRGVPFLLEDLGVSQDLLSAVRGL